MSATSEPTEYRQGRFMRPPGACEILLVRHGESAPYRVGTPHPLVDGQGDPPLDPEGERQAVLVADRLISTGEPISAIYVTTMQRTHQTASPLAAALGLTPIVEADLREVHLGEWEGGEYRRRMAEFGPIAQQVFAEGRWDAIPGAESTEAFAERITAGIQRIASSHPDQVVAAFVHGGVIAQIIAAATSAKSFGFVGADNASISHIVVTDQTWVVRCFNDTSHLSPTFTVAASPLL
jgi:2,3-bisphosphoglycerate-dependent phosphoglycerate mutase